MAIEHKEVPGLYYATFATPGETPMWVGGISGDGDEAQPRPRCADLPDKGLQAEGRNQIIPLRRQQDARTNH
jgi:hypothetical protein